MALSSFPAPKYRLVILLAGCAIPLLLIIATTSFFHPEYLPHGIRTYSPLLSAQVPVPSDSRVSHASSIHESSTSPLPTGEISPWTFDHSRDERNFGLSHEQCALAFPDYFRQIDIAVAHREQVGRISREEIDLDWRENEMLRAMIYDHQLYIIDVHWAPHGFDVPRALAILNSIHRSIVAYQGAIPNIEFTICLGDIATNDPEDKHAVWTLTRRAPEVEKWVMPDFGYWSWPLDVVGEYSQIRTEILELEESLDQPFFSKIPQAVWRGAVATNDLRRALLDQAAGKDWADVQEIVWLNMTTMAPGMDAISLTTPEFCQYQFAIHTEGHSYSGRGKYLLNCRSVTIAHNLTWLEPHTHLMTSSGPDQNFVEVSNDFGNLDAAMRGLLENPYDAATIADNAIRTFRERYLTPAAQACYWRRLFEGWRSVQGFEPQLWEETPDKATTDISDRNSKQELRARRMRGKPYETFILEGFHPNPEAR